MTSQGIQNDGLTPDDWRLLDRAAKEYLHRELVLGGGEGRQAGCILPSMVSDYVDGIALDADGAIGEALRRQLPLRRLYRHLLKQRRVATEIEQAAAAGGPTGATKLVLDRATLLLQEAFPGSGQQILRLQLREDVPVAPEARPLLHMEWDEGVARIRFLELADGVAHYLLPADDPRFSARYRQFVDFVVGPRWGSKGRSPLARLLG